MGGEKYDQVALEIMQACSSLANALTNYGYVLSAMGYNYGVGNDAKPRPARPAVQPLAEYKVSIPTSVHDNGPGVHQRDGAGIAEFYDKLVGKIGEEFGKLPNGDTTKLETAATAWRTFSENSTIAGASGHIAATIGLFDSVVDKTNLDQTLARLSTMRDAAGLIALASQNLAAPVAEFHTGTVEARGTFESEINTLVVSAGIAVGIGVVAAAFSFGGSLAISGGAVGALVINTINTIRAAYTASKLYRLLGLVAATATAGVVLTHFDKVPSLADVSTGLAAIIAMRVLIDDASEGDDVEPDFRHGEYTQAEIEEFINGHTGDGNPAMDRPSAAQVHDALTKGKPEPMGDGRSPEQAEQFVYNGVRVIVNYEMPWKSTAFKL